MRGLIDNRWIKRNQLYQDQTCALHPINLPIILFFSNYCTSHPTIANTHLQLHKPSSATDIFICFNLRWISFIFIYELSKNLKYWSFLLFWLLRSLCTPFIPIPYLVSKHYFFKQYSILTFFHNYW
jgi:hypothetical protein